jgi:hypothetical protein
VEPNEQAGIILGQDPIPINPKIVNILQKDYGIDSRECESDVRRSKFNDTTTSYYLIAKRKERGGIFRQKYKDELMEMLKPKSTKQQKPLESSIHGPRADTLEMLDQSDR